MQDVWRAAAAADPAVYHRDRGRRVEGRVVDANQRAIAANVRVVDQLELGRRVHELHGAGARAWLDLHIAAPQVGVASDENGVFSLRDQPVGSRMLYFDAPGFAPLRTQDVIVRDGLGTWNAGGSLRPESTQKLELDQLGGASTARARLVYRGYWPDLEWRDVRVGDVLELERRDPDGFPSWLALECGSELQWFALTSRAASIAHGADANSSAGSATTRTASDGGAATAASYESYPESAPSAAQRRVLSDVPRWRPTARAWIGVPELCRESESALAWAEGRMATASGLEAGTGTATLAFQADTSFASIELVTATGARRSAFSDAYGEVVYAQLPAGLYLARTSLIGGGRSAWRGVLIADGGFARVKFSGADGTPGEADASPALVGCVRRTGVSLQPVADAVVRWFGPADSSGAPYGEARCDEHGFFRIPGLLPGSTYQLNVRAKGGNECAATLVNATMSPAAAENPGGVIVELPDTALRVHVSAGDSIHRRALWVERIAPTRDSGNGAVRAGSDDAASESAVPTVIEVSDKPYVELDGWEPGRYRLSLRERGRELAVREVDLESGLRGASIDLWD